MINSLAKIMIEDINVKEKHLLVSVHHFTFTLIEILN